MTVKAADDFLLAEYTRDLYLLRAWALAQMRRGYAAVDTDNIDTSFVTLVPLLVGVTQTSILRAQQITDIYLQTVAAIRGIDYSVGGGVRPPQVLLGAKPTGVMGQILTARGPSRLTTPPSSIVTATSATDPWTLDRYRDRAKVVTSGRPTREAFVNAPYGVKAAIKQGASPAQAVARSQNISQSVVGSEAHRVARDMSAFQVTDPRSPFTRWRRIPSPGACDWCIVMAMRGATYRSVKAARAGHANCRCVVQASEVDRGDSYSAIDPADMLRTVKIRGANNATYSYNLATGDTSIVYADGRNVYGSGYTIDNVVELRPPPAFWERRAANRA